MKGEDLRGRRKTKMAENAVRRLANRRLQLLCLSGCLRQIGERNPDESLEMWRDYAASQINQLRKSSSAARQRQRDVPQSTLKLLGARAADNAGCQLRFEPARQPRAPPGDQRFALSLNRQVDGGV
jgi:hypothetical protein